MMNTAGTANRSVRASLAAVALMLMSDAAAAASAIVRPASSLGLSCSGCHRPGQTSTEFVRLDSLSADAIETSMKGFRDQPRTDSIMARFARGLDDEQIHRLATELSKNGAAP